MTFHALTPSSLGNKFNVKVISYLSTGDDLIRSFHCAPLGLRATGVT